MVGEFQPIARDCVKYDKRSRILDSIGHIEPEIVYV